MIRYYLGLIKRIPLCAVVIGCNTASIPGIALIAYLRGFIAYLTVITIGHIIYLSPPVSEPWRFIYSGNSFIGLIWMLSPGYP